MILLGCVVKWLPRYGITIYYIDLSLTINQWIRLTLSTRPSGINCLNQQKHFSYTTYYLFCVRIEEIIFTQLTRIILLLLLLYTDKEKERSINDRKKIVILMHFHKRQWIAVARLLRQIAKSRVCIRTSLCT